MNMSNFKNPPIFKNNHYQKMEKSGYLNFFATSANWPADKERVEISDLRHVFFELSNLCNYANIHPQCPVSWQKKKVILSSKVVKGVIDQLGKEKFKGYIAFHRYNEPTNDPRLFEFIAYAKKHAPKAKIRLLTNGSYLNQTMADDLKDAGLNILEVSSYMPKEHQRLIKLKVNIPYMVTFQILDDRKTIYATDKLNLHKPCFAHINDITINCEGKMPICCLDWKNQVVFGDLNKDSLDKILHSRFFTQTFKLLSKGTRNLDICSRCDWSR